MLRLAVIALCVMMVSDPEAAGNALMHYRDFILAALLAVALQPWVLRQFD